MIKCTRKLLSFSLIALPIVLLAMVFIAHWAFAEQKPKPVASQKAIGVLVTQVAYQTIPKRINAFGHVEAIKAVDLSFVVDGHLTKIIAHSGQRVKEGAEIASLDDQAAEAQLKSLEADLQLSQSTYQRMQQIEKFGGVSQQMIESKKAEVVKAQAQVAQQKIVIQQKKLYAPFEGVLGIFKYSVGAYLPAGTALVSLVQQAPLKVKYTVPATLRSQLEIGQTVTITSSSFPDKTFPGILSFVAPEVNKNTGTITLEARVDNPDYLLMPGMFVNVEQVINPNRKLLVIPDVALMTDIMGQYVYTVTDHHVKKVYVTVEGLQDNFAIIKKGLKEGDVVVTAGQQKLNDGDLIKVLKAGLTATSSKSPSLPAAAKQQQEKPQTDHAVKSTSLSSSAKK